MSRNLLADLLDGDDPGTDSPDVPRVQPKPAGVLMANIGADWTVITRTWDPGDEGRCRLCPKHRCNARNGVCMVVVPGNVPDAEAALWPLQGAPRPGHAAPR